MKRAGIKLLVDQKAPVDVQLVVGEVVSKLLGENPEHEVEEDLKRLQSELERTGSTVRRAA